MRWKWRYGDGVSQNAFINSAKSNHLPPLASFPLIVPLAPYICKVFWKSLKTGILKTNNLRTKLEKSKKKKTLILRSLGVNVDHPLEKIFSNKTSPNMTSFVSNICSKIPWIFPNQCSLWKYNFTTLKC